MFIRLFQDPTSFLRKAMEENSNVIYNFTLKLSNTEKSSSRCNDVSEEIRGQKISHFDRDYDNTYFYFQLLTNKEKLGIFLENVKRTNASKYDIRFQDNRTTFLSQHLALQYMLEHNLVNCLVNNDMYDKEMLEEVVNVEHHVFRYAFFHHSHSHKLTCNSQIVLFIFFTKLLVVKEQNI